GTGMHSRWSTEVRGIVWGQFTLSSPSGVPHPVKLPVAQGAARLSHSTVKRNKMIRTLLATTAPSLVITNPALSQDAAPATEQAPSTEMSTETDVNTGAA